MKRLKPGPEGGKRNGAIKEAPDPREVLRRYKKRPNRPNESALLECYRSLVERSAWSFMKKLPPTVDVQDLFQAGMFGLLKAARRYDESRGVPFESFCLARIKGSIQDELRNQDWLPRRNGKNGKKGENGERHPHFLHLSIHPSGDEEDLFLDLQDESKPDEAVLEALYREELLERVRRSLTTLEWRILHDSYIRGMTLKKVASRLSLSTSRVCILRARILEKVRRQLAVERD